MEGSDARVALTFGASPRTTGGAMIGHDEMLDFYARPSAMTSAGEYASLLDELPRDVGALAPVVQGLVVHQYMGGAYGAEFSAERRGESHIRPVDRMLARLLEHDDRPLSTRRPVDARFVGVCRHFEVLAMAVLRAKRVPVRARCGFATYFEPGRFVDHWVCEYWRADEGRWARADVQLDEVQRAKYRTDFDVLEVPRDRFVTAGDAWTQCRTGDADPAKFGIMDLHGLWFVAGNVIRDLAALNDMEMLPWDAWGAMPRQDETLSTDQLDLFDRLAAITRAPDASFAELRALYASDDRVRVPAVVFNAVRQRPEPI